MNAVIPIHPNKNQAITLRQAAYGDTASTLADVYREDTNIAIWRRKLPSSLRRFAEGFLTFNSSFQTAMTVNPKNVFTNVEKSLGVINHSATELSENVAELVNMFCDLFEAKQVSLRFRVLDQAMCPRFHVDRVPCRLVTTYSGVATQWLPDHLVDRTKLGVGSKGQPDDQSGVYPNENAIYQLNSGDVGLLKGELWDGNENNGLVHRSPQVSTGERRLLLTLDFID